LHKQNNIDKYSDCGFDAFIPCGMPTSCRAGFAGDTRDIDGPVSGAAEIRVKQCDFDGQKFADPGKRSKL